MKTRNPRVSAFYIPCSQCGRENYVEVHRGFKGGATSPPEEPSIYQIETYCNCPDSIVEQSAEEWLRDEGIIS